MYVHNEPWCKYVPPVPHVLSSLGGTALGDREVSSLQDAAVEVRDPPVGFYTLSRATELDH